jgi:hypothetical protein
MFVNLTPHDIVLNNGTVFPKSGTVARVSVTHGPFDQNGICRTQYGEVIGLPDSLGSVVYIVSTMVLAACKGKGREDVVAPATGHPDCVRDAKGQIVSVPGLVWG